MPHVLIHEAVVAPALERLVRTGEAVWLGASLRDDGDLVSVDGSVGSMVVVTDDEADASGPSARVRLTPTTGPPAFVVDLDGGSVGVACTVDGARAECTVIPRAVDVFDRVRGVFETDVLRDATVGIIGLGSGGSFIAGELAKAGVGGFVLVDHDRLEVGNVCRHLLGLSDVGRLKVLAMRDALLDRNPSARIEVVPVKVEGTTIAAVAEAIAGCDLVICATDNRESRLLVNRVTVQAEQRCLYGAVFRRAYGGQVLSVIPGLTPCYQCFIAALPQMGYDQEVSNADAAAAIAYSDRPVAIEPGLSSDVLPIALMMVKVAIVALLEGKKTTLSSLRRDLVAPLYLWLNRREQGTDYADLPPLENDVGSMTILRWYGIHIGRHPRCPACGGFEEALLERFGVDAGDIDPDLFG